VTYCPARPSELARFPAVKMAAGPGALAVKEPGAVLLDSVLLISCDELETLAASPSVMFVTRIGAIGIGNREVAQRPSIKENTVKKALLWIYDKLGVSNRVELVLYAVTHGGVYEASPLPTSTPPAAEPLALGFVSVSPKGLAAPDLVWRRPGSC
jgi:DNA-binding CsgD family transcriptional regulator